MSSGMSTPQSSSSRSNPNISMPSSSSINPSATPSSSTTTPSSHTKSTSRSKPKPLFTSVPKPVTASNSITRSSQPSLDSTIASRTRSVHVARKSDPDTLTFDEAMRDEHREQWIEAAIKELRELESHNSWIEVPTEEAKGEKIVPVTWVFKIKRAPDGRVKRFKARFCVRGDLMRGITDTYSPVVAFSTVRLFLIMSILLSWDTSSIDFSNAFIQTMRSKPVFIQVPRGCRHLLDFYGGKYFFGCCVDAAQLYFDRCFASIFLPFSLCVLYFS